MIWDDIWWQTLGAHNAQNQIERSGSDFFTLGPSSPVFGFMGFLVLSSFALFHTILATCSSHTGMSRRLFSRWCGASSRHQQYPTVVALESQLGINLLGYDPGLIFQGHFSCSRKLPGTFFFNILRGWHFVLFAKRPKFGTGGCCRVHFFVLDFANVSNVLERLLNMQDISHSMFNSLEQWPEVSRGMRPD